MITVGLYGIPDTTCGTHPTWTHDHGIALMRDGRVLTCLQLERYTGRKHDNRLPELLPELLERYLPPGEPVRFASVNSFVGNAFLSRDGNLRIEPEARVEIGPVPTPARARWFPDGLRPREAGAHIVCHELAHVASLLPFVGRFEPNSLLAHIDGGASDSACSFWFFDGQQLRLLARSWDRLKAAVNNFNVNPLVRAILGFEDWEHLSIPGKLMGYAGYGRAAPEKTAWLEANRWFLDHPDDPADLLARINDRFGAGLARFDPREPLLMDLCACMQRWFEDRVVETLLAWRAETGAEVLYYAGGAALNIPTNSRLEQHFRAVHVPPCTNDTGLALGAAAWLEFLDRGEVHRHTPFLQSFDVPAEPAPTAELDAIAEALVAGEVVGVCNGPAEVGPRALGHRSVLARADSVALRRRISESIKRREWYRPIAPVLCEAVAREALGPEVAASHLAPYMLGAYQLRPGWAERFAGVLHDDGTLRAQVVPGDEPQHAFLHQLLVRLWERHGLAGLINTSFNVKGEPILHRHEDALSAARRMGLDMVVVHGSIHRP